MDPINIESAIPVEKVSNIIDGSPMKNYAELKHEEKKDRIRYTFTLDKDKVSNEDALKDLSKFVYNIIKVEHLDEVINLNLDKKLGELDSENKSDIIEDVKEVIVSKNLLVNEKENIQEEIYEYLLENNTLIVDGYIYFRSESVDELIDKAIEFVLGNFELDVDYEEFVEMLQTLVENQVSEIELVNLVIEDGKYKILDKDLNKVKNEKLNEALEEASGDEVNNIDLILSMLITLNPDSIILHLGDAEEGQLASILKDVFEGKVEICKGCELCNK